MNANQLFEMLLSQDSNDRALAKSLIHNLIIQKDYVTLRELQSHLDQYQDYPGYEIIVDKEEAEDIISAGLENFS